MSRAILGLVAAALAVSVSGQALAADWGATGQPMFKPAYPVDMAPMEDDIDFEAGLRYYYGMGGQSTSIGNYNFEAEDASHFLELHGRIDDRSTNTYLTGNIGYAAIIDGSYQQSVSGVDGPRMNTSSGMIAYGGADFGYLPFGNDAAGVGAFVGYQYLNESLDIGRANFYLPSGGGDSEPNLLEIHGLRLGVTAKAEFGDLVDFTVNAAAIPYAALNGTYGAYGPGVDGISPGQGSAATITGHLYGGAVDAMVGFRATDNIVLRAGARGYYLTGPTETYYEMRDADGSNGQGFIVEGQTDLFRWGPMIELTGTF